MAIIRIKARLYFDTIVCSLHIRLHTIRRNGIGKSIWRNVALIEHFILCGLKTRKVVAGNLTSCINHAKKYWAIFRSQNIENFAF